MKKVFLTGANGFVGKNLTLFLQKNTTHSIVNYDKNLGHLDMTNLDVVIHLAGKAHDLKNVDNAEAYYEVNTNLTKKVFDGFIKSNAKVFITLSSVKAATDELNVELTEEHQLNPITHYGKSKLLAEQYILSKDIPHGKRVYILRPCMIHGPGNKGNLNLLYKIVSKGFPWPLGAFDNKRSFCSIDNLSFIINELMEIDLIPSGSSANAFKAEPRITGTLSPGYLYFVKRSLTSISTKSRISLSSTISTLFKKTMMFGTFTCLASKICSLV